MALELWINDTDLSSYVQAAEDEFNPANAFQEPQFANNSLTDGDLYISMTTRNREWSVPLLLIAAGNDALAALVRTINNSIVQGATVKYREDGATNYTYFDLETGTLEADYKYQRNRQGVGIFQLKLFTRGLGHTGTIRTVGTISATGWAVLPVASFGLSGDGPAQIELRSSVPVATTGQPSMGLSCLFYGYSPHSDYQSMFTPSVSGPAIVPSSGAGTASITVVGDGAALASRTISIQNLGSGNYANFMITPLPTSLRTGLHRLFASVKCGMHASGAAADDGMNPSSYPAYIRWADTTNQEAALLKTETKIFGATAFQSSGAYHLYDLGIFSHAQGHLPLATDAWLTVQVKATNIATTLSASMPIAVESLHFIPAEQMGALFTATLSQLRLAHTILISTASSVADTSTYPGHTGDPPELRGEFPQLANMATGALIVVAGEHRPRGPDNAAGRMFSLTVGAREQFRYLR